MYYRTNAVNVNGGKILCPLMIPTIGMYECVYVYVYALKYRCVCIQIKAFIYCSSLYLYDLNFSELMASHAASANFLKDMKENWVENVPELFLRSASSSMMPMKSVSSSVFKHHRGGGNRNNVCYIDPLQQGARSFWKNEHAQPPKTNDNEPGNKQQKQSSENNSKIPLKVTLDKIGEFSIEIFEDGKSIPMYICLFRILTLIIIRSFTYVYLCVF